MVIVAGGSWEGEVMPSFTAPDGAELAFRVLGEGEPLVCLPGGPGLTPDYLGDLGGLAASRQLILPETRGTGRSAAADPSRCRCDRLVGDVAALRAYLGLDRMDLLGHSAAADLAVLYAAAHPDRVGRLILLAPATFALGLSLTEEEFVASMERRAGEPWYPAARSAATAAGEDTIERRRAYAPLFYGRWDDAARAHAVMEFEGRARAVEAAYYGDGAFDPAATRAAVAGLAAPVLVYIGGLDVNPTAELGARVASLFPRGELVVQPGAGHFPWLDDPAWFTSAISRFLVG